MNDTSPEQLDFPTNWDRLIEPPAGSPEERTDVPSAGGPGPPPTALLVAAAWADLVCLLLFCVTAILTVMLAGYGVSLVALPWVSVLAAAWWAGASAVLVVVRRGTPGMLIAGIVFKSPVVNRRLPVILVVAVLLACTLGLPALVGAQRSPLRWAGGSPLATSSDSAAAAGDSDSVSPWRA